MPFFMQEPNASSQSSTYYPSTPVNNASMSIIRNFDLDGSINSSVLTINEANENNSFDNKSIINGANDFMEAQQRTISLGSATNVSSSGSNLSLINPSESTRIGYLRCLQIFFFHSSNLLLNRNNFHRDKIKNVCCYTLEIYKLFIRKIKMDHYTWTMLITILLKIAEFLFNSEYLINNRNEPATSQLIKLTTEVLI